MKRIFSSIITTLLALNMGVSSVAFAKEELGFEQVQALIHENNLPSIRVAEKIGFSRQQSLEEADSKNIRFTLKM